MAGINFGSLFPRNFQFDDEGRALIESTAESKRYVAQIIIAGYAINTTTTIYTVPANKTLFIASSWIDGTNTDAVDNWDMTFTAGSKVLYDIWINPTSDTRLSQTYKMPINVPAGQTITISSGDSPLIAQCGFTGWLEDA